MKTFLGVAVGLFFSVFPFGLIASEVIDAQGNVIMFTGDNLTGCPACHDLLKLSGKTGAIIWRVSPSGVYLPSILIDKKNDVILFGKEDFSCLIKFSGSSGRLIWSADVSSLFMVNAIVDKNANLFVDAYTQDGRYVVKFDGVAGGKLWETKID